MKRFKETTVQNELIDREERLALATMDKLESYFLEQEPEEEVSLEFVDRNLKFRDQGIRRRSSRAREATMMIRAMEMSSLKADKETVSRVLNHVGFETPTMLGESSDAEEKAEPARNADGAKAEGQQAAQTEGGE